MFGNKKPKEYISVGNLIDGLPVPTSTTIIVKLFPEEFTFTALTGSKKDNWKEFKLSTNKIQNLQIIDEKQIQQITEQSLSGMVLGAAAFGVLGAMVGGRVKTKDKTKIKSLLIIDYISDENKQIVLDITNNIKDSQNLVSYFYSLKQFNNTTTEL